MKILDRAAYRLGHIMAWQKAWRIIDHLMDDFHAYANVIDNLRDELHAARLEIDRLMPKKETRP